MFVVRVKPNSQHPARGAMWEKAHSTPDGVRGMDGACDYTHCTPYGVLDATK
jgi:hypothetical protein